MPSLPEAQRGLRDALLAGAAVPRWIRGGEQHAAQRLDIYRGTIIGTLVRALRLAYPTVERLVGTEFFDAAAQVFALAHLPQTADLNAYGAGFADFLQEFPACSGLPYLSDVARLDRLVTRALHADDAAPLAAHALAQVDPEQVPTLRFRFHPSVGLLQSQHPVDAIWAAVLSRDDAAMAAIDLQAGPVHLLVERAVGRAVVSRMDPSDWQGTSALAQGRCFGDCLSPGNEAAIANLLAAHLAAHRLVAFHTDVIEEDLP